MGRFFPWSIKHQANFLGNALPFKKFPEIGLVSELVHTGSLELVDFETPVDELSEEGVDILSPVLLGDWHADVVPEFVFFLAEKEGRMAV